MFAFYVHCIGVNKSHCMCSLHYFASLFLAEIFEL